MNLGVVYMEDNEQISLFTETDENEKIKDYKVYSPKGKTMKR